jgi:hypothetical protein
MAISKQSRSALPIGTIFLAFLFVIATAFAIVFYLQVGKLRKQESAAKSRLELYVSPAAQSNPELSPLISAASPDRTVVAQLLKQITELKQAISGTSAPVSQIVGVTGTANATLSAVGIQTGTPLITAIKKLGMRLAAAKKSADEYHALYRNYRRRFHGVEASFNANLAAMKRKLAEAETRVAALTTERNGLASQVAAQASNFQGQISAQQTKYVSDLRNQVVQSQQYKQELARKDMTISQLRATIAGSRPPSQGADAIEAQAAGKVLKVSSNGDLVYVNLGRADHISVGLSFAVYSAEEGVGSGKHAGGKGSIVITKVGQYASVARITHVAHNQAIYPGDLIANPVYSRDLHRHYTFVVAGDFDVNGNGVPTAAGRRDIIRMIKSWGGKVVNHLTSQTDFLVLGSPPSTTVEPGTPSRDNSALAQMQAQSLARYNSLQSRAQSLSIPVLDADRFLAMVGYYVHPLEPGD